MLGGHDRVTIMTQKIISVMTATGFGTEFEVKIGQKHDFGLFFEKIEKICFFEIFEKYLKR